MQNVVRMSKDSILDYVYYLDDGNWLETKPPVTANAPVCKCGCGEPYSYDSTTTLWEAFCAISSVDYEV